MPVITKNKVSFGKKKKKSTSFTQDLINPFIKKKKRDKKEKKQKKKKKKMKKKTKNTIEENNTQLNIYFYMVIGSNPNINQSLIVNHFNLIVVSLEQGLTYIESLTLAQKKYPIKIPKSDEEKEKAVLRGIEMEKNKKIN